MKSGQKFEKNVYNGIFKFSGLVPVSGQQDIFIFFSKKALPIEHRIVFNVRYEEDEQAIMTDIPAKQRATEIFLTHYGFVMRVAFRYAPMPDLVDDVIQETFHRFVNNADRYDFQADVRPLLKTIAKNIACDYWEQRQRERTKISRLILEHVRQFGLQQASTKAEQVWDIRREQPALERCLAQLPERARSAVHAYYYQRQTIDDIAAELGSSSDGIKQLLFRIRKKLRTCVNKQLAMTGND